MRLINTTTYELKEFNRDSEIPPYAILSHRWEKEEVTFEEFNGYSSGVKAKEGYKKIKKACNQAAKDDLEYAWVDTCCINKSSSAELTESINSMFRWYQKANVCYVYLSDVSETYAEGELKHSAWFKRGWTLQELLAPSELEFYDRKWKFIGTKLDFVNRIASITGIDELVLRGERQPKNTSIAARMSWAAYRETSRVEDVAYCLLGIFDVSMPLIYGEGERSFLRLQEEIVKRSNDLTIFAWQHENGSEERDSCDLFAPTPA
ncbi:HET-domain-containing protein [Stipitochalara longipes BDJ]|nr:HET-domain-containing protein [Stipitochalara longipes BDJ]